ncbi:hypothetical protein AB5N19_10299 [Seiridium cardinale]
MRVTDIKLLKPGQVRGLEWTQRWEVGYTPISSWQSHEIKHIQVTEGYTVNPVRLSVRRFVAQERDSLQRTWVENGIEKSVTLPPYAIVDHTEATATYIYSINQGVMTCCQRVLENTHSMIKRTYGLALSMAVGNTADIKDRDILRKVLRLWTAVRMTTQSTYIVGDEYLGVEPSTGGDTGPLYGNVPIPPVMGAQIDQILVHELQYAWQEEVLADIEVLLQVWSPSSWVVGYLAAFILLHNLSLLCRYDASYALKHGIKVRKTPMVRNSLQFHHSGD